jgi:DNA-directed RNA polymerase specialized sigma24 family protein
MALGTPAASPTPPAGDAARAAFHDLHGPALYGFALVVTYGDQALAARLTGRALEDGAQRADELAHPERAAAWLRHRVTGGVPRRSRRGGPALAERRALLTTLGVEPVLADALRELSPGQRAAVIASGSEWLSRTDAAEAAASSPSGVRSARRRFLAAYLAAANRRGQEPVPGPLARRIQDAAVSVIGRR